MKLGAYSYFGTELWKRTCGDVVLTETAYCVGATLPQHSHDTAHDALVLEGAYLERVGSKAYLCLQGDLVTYPADVDHENLFGSRNARILNLEHAGCTARSASIRTQTLTPVEAMAVADLKPIKPSKTWVARARRLIDQNPGIGLSSLADQLGFHPVYLARRFRAEYGCSVGCYAQLTRIKLASRLLIESDERIAETALAAGYYDQSHMTGEFTRLTGFTPAHLRHLAHG
jgi:AraC-like DNA-binding protein